MNKNKTGPKRNIHYAKIPFNPNALHTCETQYDTGTIVVNISDVFLPFGKAPKNDDHHRNTSLTTLSLCLLQDMPTVYHNTEYIYH